MTLLRRRSGMYRHSVVQPILDVRTTLLHRESAELHCAGTCRYDAATASLDFLERRSNPEISLGPFSFGNRSWNVPVRSDGSLLRERIIGRWTEGIRFRPTRTAER